MINIAILGFGTVGSGTADVLTKNEKIIASRLGDSVNIKYILDLHDFPGHPLADRVVHDFNIILNDPEVSIIAETMGGLHPAGDFTRAALAAGKSVVTPNKELVATCGDELLELARENRVRYLFEASVGGGIPIIRPLTDDLAANEIDSVCGILNGTTNYILTGMASDGAEFDDKLREAQRLGYAEANPAADIDGIDAARKIIILAAIAYGKLLPADAVKVCGIRGLNRDDVRLAEAAGCAIKLIASTSRDENGAIYASVSPSFVRRTCPLCHIEGVFNGILVRGNMSGDLMFYGSGAGKLPTASAVVSDIIDALERPSAAPSCFNWTKAQPEDIAQNAPSGGVYCIFDDASAIPSGAERIEAGGLCAVYSESGILAGSVRSYPVVG